MAKHICILLFTLVAPLCAELDASDKKILVLLDNESIKTSHSKYFKSLSGKLNRQNDYYGQVSPIFFADKGFELDYKQADAASLALFRYGERVYNNIIIFAPSVDGNFLAKN